MKEESKGKSTSLELEYLRETAQDEQALKLFDVAPLPYQSLDEKGNIIHINRAWMNLLGYEYDDVIGTNFEDYLSPVSIPLFKERFCAFLQRGEAHSVEYSMVRSDGITRQVQVIGRVSTHADGSFKQTHCILHDISDKRRAEEELAASEHQFRSLFESSIDGIICSDENGAIINVNPAICGMLGRNGHDLVGKSVWDITPEEWMAPEKDLLRRQVCMIGFCEEFRKELIHADGHNVPVSIRLWIRRDEFGNNIGNWVLVRDITEQIRTEQILKDSERKYRDIFERSLEGLYQSTPRGKFIDVNPALAKIMGYKSPDQLMNMVKNIAEDLYVNSKERVLLVETLNNDGGITDFEIQIRRKDGRFIWVSVTARTVYGSDGTPVMYEGSMIDITERKMTEEALKLTQFSVDHAPISIYWVNEQGQFVYINNMGCQALGYTREELSTMTVADINPTMHPEDWSERWKTRGSQKINRFESVHERKDGSTFPVGLTTYSLTYGSEEFLFSYADDLSERHKGEKELRRSRNLLNEVQRISRTGGWDVNLKTGKIFWTEGQLHLHGIQTGEPPDSMMKYLDEFIHPEDKAAARAVWRSIIKNRIPAEMECRIIRTDGTEATMVSVGVPVVNEKGELERIYGSSRDVTNERLAARELEESHQRLLTILDGIEADIYVSDINSDEILFLNAHMRNNFGDPGEKTRCHDMFRDEKDHCRFCPKGDLLDSHGNPMKTQVTERYSAFKDRWYLNHDRAIEWLEGRMVHMHMAADITELKNMERELKLAMAETKEASNAKNEFLANMSHEIRTPLNGLLGMLQILQLTKLKGEQQDYLNTALDSGRNLLQVLNDILDLTKIESGKLDFEEYDMELGEVLNSVVQVFRHMAEQRGVSMTWEIDETLQRHFSADKGRLRQILFNLVGNAVKFTESGSVTVKAYPLSTVFDDGRTQLYFSVADTGIGIPDDKIDQIFDPFTQVDGSFSRKYQGTGLGLGIVHRLVTLMGGSIAVSSQLGKGTTIIFTIMVGSQQLPHHSQPPLTEIESRPLSILLAEDEHVNRLVAKRLLSKLGHTVTTVENGEDAIALLGERSFDLLLSDIQMPGMDGMETTRIIRNKLKLDIPVIALTAHAMKGDRGRFIKAGMDGYIAKPFELTELKEELVRVMNLRHTEKH
ncbi:PAS domain S-box protein [Pseudodesulfovibrio piezophilus]|uniref:histidine kinase n=1 Tax=Pseudodesulfovibrio piezophilus (strain DSM 21447 / JCM 15486 / C1TLV30) TaxID=1322246 RepID=M1WWL5_PSEP2